MAEDNLLQNVIDDGEIEVDVKVEDENLDLYVSLDENNEWLVRIVDIAIIIILILLGYLFWK